MTPSFGEDGRGVSQKPPAESRAIFLSVDFFEPQLRLAASGSGSRRASQSLCTGSNA